MVAAELGVFHEAVGGDEGEEVFFGDEVVVFAVLFASAGLTCCVCTGQREVQIWDYWRRVLGQMGF